MQIINSFSIGIGSSYLSEGLELGRNIFSQNRHLLVEGQTNVTSFVHQNYHKHVVKENYTNEDDVEKLKSLLLNEGINYLKEMKWYLDFYEYEVTNLWLNEYYLENHCQGMHSHPGYLVSGTYYIDVPINSNPIVFYNPTMHIIPSGMLFSENNNPNFKFNEYNSTTWTFYPKEGEVFFWPSNLIHSVDKSEFKGTRRSISFDINTKKFLRKIN